MMRRYGCVVGPFSLSPLSSLRFVQYQQTSETNRAVESGDKKTAMKWMTKSTREYMTEEDRSRASKNPEKEKAVMWKEKEKRSTKEMYLNNEKMFETEITKLTDFKQRRFRKSFDFFKRQGFAFFVVYVATYVGALAALYIFFASDLISKSAVYEIIVGTTGMLDREEFLNRVEAWDTYINFGFAFVLNEMLEVFRLPLVMITFFTFKPAFMKLGRGVKKSIFNRSAPEI